VKSLRWGNEVAGAEEDDFVTLSGLEGSDRDVSKMKTT
jgi:hypothetical protein